MKTETPTRLNGIDTNELAAIVGAVQENPALGQVAFRVTTAWQGGTRSEARVEDWTFGGETLPRDFTIATDEPKQVLGNDSAPNPQELLLAALNACMMVGYVAQSSVQGIELELLEIETTSGLDLQGFLGLDENVPAGNPEMHYTVRIKGNGTPEQFEEIHQLVQATSPNYWNLTRPVKLVPTLDVL